MFLNTIKRKKYFDLVYTISHIRYTRYRSSLQLLHHPHLLLRINKFPE